ncbi:hypothetical protein J4G48_0014850 [Bradyrhizobium barranii subsp. apii]|uniref:hypothetical protein n=1 Tax=Bradyrhizobium barranii TaxID=2992140 RepID=UPI001AA1BB3F|nr:hypothetical protein [Bradyrhizobium barranii]UPT99245.1 hypothetical protein J4G48_0014850 [Bradyrhizobium barranii subsp. apii]
MWRRLGGAITTALSACDAASNIGDAQTRPNFFSLLIFDLRVAQHQRRLSTFNYSARRSREPMLA